MISLKNSFLLAALLAFITPAQAVIINFQDMADGTYGESAWKPLSLSGFGVDVDIYGVHGGADAYAYLDAGTAGLGVCRNLNSTGEARLNAATAGSGTNLCDPGSDDNVNIYDGVGESLNFVFNEGVEITGIWFNNNHDPDYGMGGDAVTIGGVDHVFSGGADDADLGWLFEFSGTDGIFAALDDLSIAYYTGTEYRAEEFYISAIEISSVPEPTALVLLGIGLIGIGAARRFRSL